MSGHTCTKRDSEAVREFYLPTIIALWQLQMQIDKGV